MYMDILREWDQEKSSIPECLFRCTLFSNITTYTFTLAIFRSPPPRCPIRTKRTGIAADGSVVGGPRKHSCFRGTLWDNTKGMWEAYLSVNFTGTSIHA